MPGVLPGSATTSTTGEYEDGSINTAFAERLRFLGDHANSFERAQAMVDGRLQALQPRPDLAHSGTETTTISVIDGDGNAASLILSIFADFGSGIVTDETGWEKLAKIRDRLPYLQDIYVTSGAIHAGAKSFWAAIEDAPESLIEKES